ASPAALVCAQAPPPTINTPASRVVPIRTGFFVTLTRTSSPPGRQKSHTDVPRKVRAYVLAALGSHKESTNGHTNWLRCGPADTIFTCVKVGPRREPPARAGPAYRNGGSSTLRS